MRLQKFLAHAGVCSRRKAETYITEGRVRVNGKRIIALGTQVEPSKDKVTFDSREVELPDAGQGFTYIAVNKPKGVVTTCSQENERIILDLVPKGRRIYPVGRLDKDSIGLVLLTDDGELHNRLSHPSHDHEKEYLVTTVHPVKDEALKKMAAGMMIEGKRTRKARVKRTAKNGFKIILKQGRNRQIRKMVGKTGNKVDMLKRIRMANINLGGLKSGRWRNLTEKEVKILTQ
ncbi:MAG: rRNA pseudouridine synthase [Desulfobacterales bacterium]|nr:rRNA pseudouridine synthase [Desulfobacterales bacterium]